MFLENTSYNSRLSALNFQNLGHFHPVALNNTPRTRVFKQALFSKIYRRLNPLALVSAIISFASRDNIPVLRFFALVLRYVTPRYIIDCRGVMNTTGNLGKISRFEDESLCVGETRMNGTRWPRSRLRPNLSAEWISRPLIYFIVIFDCSFSWCVVVVRMTLDEGSRFWFCNNGSDSGVVVQGGGLGGFWRMWFTKCKQRVMQKQTVCALRSYRYGSLRLRK